MIIINGLTIGNNDNSYYGNPNSLAITISGGIDSALVLYLLAKELNDTSNDTPIYIITGHRHPDQLPAARRVVNYVKDKFPNINWQTHWDYNNIWDHSLYIDRGRSDVHARASFLRYHDIRHILHGRVLTTLASNEMDNLSKNYPVQVAKIIKREKAFKWTKNHKANNGHYYRTHYPITFNTKKEVVDMFHEFNIEDLLPQTISCFHQSKTPCEVCPSCIEKHRLIDTLFVC